MSSLSKKFNTQGRMTTQILFFTIGGGGAVCAALYAPTYSRSEHTVHHALNAKTATQKGLLGSVHNGQYIRYYALGLRGGGQGEGAAYATAQQPQRQQPQRREQRP